MGLPHSHHSPGGNFSWDRRLLQPLRGHHHYARLVGFKLIFHDVHLDSGRLVHTQHLIVVEVGLLHPPRVQASYQIRTRSLILSHLR